MKFSLFSSLQRRLQWLNLPTAVLIAFLQRSPVVRMVAAVEEMVTASPVGTVIKSVAAAAAALGAVNSMAGATPLIPSAGTDTGITATVGTAFSVAYGANSPLGPASSWAEMGGLPPGLGFSNNGASSLISGTPTTAGNYTFTLQAFGPNGEEVDYGYTIMVQGGTVTNVAPTISTQPASQTVSAGANVTFSVGVSGTPAPTIQWQKGSTAIAGATSATLTLTNVQASDAATYTAVATNSQGTATSTGAVLTVNVPAPAAPAFTSQPASQSATIGGNVTFTTVVSGSPIPTIQWQKGSTPIAGATNASLTLNNVQTGDAATYTAVATNASGTATSTGAVLTISAAPAAPLFTTQPATQTATAGGSVTFTVAVSGSPTPTIQWQKGSTAIAGATTTTLTLSNVQAGDAATYTAVATNASGTATSTGAILTVTPSLVPTITSQPQGHTVATGATVVFGADVTGGGLSYQWSKNGAPISGATSSQFLIANSQPSDNGNYSFTATNGSGSVTSTAATLAVTTTSDPGRIVNVSVRIVSGINDQVLIVGFVTAGAGTSGNKQLLIRGVGPTLAGFGVPNTLADPILNIIPTGSSTPLVTNDNWGGDAAVVSAENVTGAFALPDPTSKDAALVATLPAGVYSAKVSGANNTTGTALAEIYDANPTPFNPTTPRLVNVSARAQTSNDNPLITGFVITGSTAKTVMIRAVGPTLTGYGVGGAMSDPQLLLYVHQNGVDNLLFTNDNWGGAPLITATANTVGAASLSDPASKDAVLLLTLDPGIYSAKVLGVNNVSGIALVEVYDVQ